MMPVRATLRIFCSLSLLTAASAPATELTAPLPIPFHEPFSGETLDSGWKIDAADGNTVRAAGGALKIRARKNSYAHIERPLDEDLVRVSATMEPDGAITWAPSLFLYWNPGNWCQTSVINRGGGMLHTAEMIDGKFIEHDLEPLTLPGTHDLGIELAIDCLRYTVKSGADWKTVATLPRPEQFRPAPALLIVGKGFGGSAGAPAPGLNNNYTSTEEWVESSIRDIRTERLPVERVMETREERAVRTAALADRWGAEELAAPGDPTLDSVARHFPPLKFSREVIGVKDHPVAIGVAHDGTLQPNDGVTDPKQPIVYFQIGEPGYRFGSGSDMPKKRLHQGWMPVVIAADNHGDLSLEQTAFARSEGMTTSAPLIGYVRLALSSAASTETAVRLIARKDGKETVLRQWTVSVGPNQPAAVQAAVPYEYEKMDVASVEAAEFDTRLADVARYWDQLIAPATRFTVPEETVQNGYRAWLAYNFLNIKQRGDVRHICDGSGFYNVIYGYSAALYCHILDLVGYHDFSREYIDEMLTLQQPDGLWYLNFGHTDTGTMLKVIAEHYRLTRDSAWLKKTAPRIMKMHEWIAGHRKESMNNVHGRRSAVHGLIRFRPYCDYEAPAYDYYSNSYLCVGLEDAAEVLAEIGMSGEAKTLADEAAAYRKDILASMDASIITRDGVRMLPLFPENQFLLKESNYTANGYYGLVASCLLETAFLPRDDARTQLIMDMLEKRGGLTAGVCRFFDQIDHAYTYGYWQTCMNRDQVKPVILGLYGSMAYGMSRDTYAAVECTAIKTGENAHTLPHTYSNTKQVRLLRNMLVREDGDKLLLAHFTPRPWLQAGKQVAVKDAPTSFGLVSYSITPGTSAGGADAGSSAEMNVKLTPPTVAAPSEIRLRLRHPDGKSIQSVSDLGNVRHEVAGHTIILTGATQPLEMRVRFE